MTAMRCLVERIPTPVFDLVLTEMSSTVVVVVVGREKRSRNERNVHSVGIYRKGRKQRLHFIMPACEYLDWSHGCRMAKMIGGLKSGDCRLNILVAVVQEKMHVVVSFWGNGITATILVQRVS